MRNEDVSVARVVLDGHASHRMNRDKFDIRCLGEMTCSELSDIEGG